MKYGTKMSRAIAAMPCEMIIQWSSGTDLISFVVDRAINEALASRKDTLEVLLDYAKDTLSLYYESGHINCEMKEENPIEWRQEVKELKQYIARLERYTNDNYYSIKGDAK